MFSPENSTTDDMRSSVGRVRHWQRKVLGCIEKQLPPRCQALLFRCSIQQTRVQEIHSALLTPRLSGAAELYSFQESSNTAKAAVPCSGGLPIALGAEEDNFEMERRHSHVDAKRFHDSVKQERRKKRSKRTYLNQGPGFNRSSQDPRRKFI